MKARSDPGLFHGEDVLRSNALIPELAVQSLGESLAFYRDLLGFAVAYARPEEGFAFLQLGDAQLMLDQIGLGRTFDADGPLSRPLGRGLNLQIEVSAVQPLLQALERATGRSICRRRRNGTAGAARNSASGNSSWPIRTATCCDRSSGWDPGGSPERG